MPALEYPIARLPAGRLRNLLPCWPEFSHGNWYLAECGVSSIDTDENEDGECAAPDEPPPILECLPAPPAR